MAMGSLFDFLMIFFSDRVKNFYEDGPEEAAIQEEKKPSDKTEMSSINPVYVHDEPAIENGNNGNGNYFVEKKVWNIVNFANHLFITT